MWLTDSCKNKRPFFGSTWAQTDDLTTYTCTRHFSLTGTHVTAALLWNKKPYLLSWLFEKCFQGETRKGIWERAGELFWNTGINAVLIPLLWDVVALRHRCLSADWFKGVSVFWWVRLLSRQMIFDAMGLFAREALMLRSQLLCCLHRLWHTTWFFFAYLTLIGGVANCKQINEGIMHASRRLWLYI